MFSWETFEKLPFKVTKIKLLRFYLVWIVSIHFKLSQFETTRGFTFFFPLPANDAVLVVFSDAMLFCQNMLKWLLITLHTKISSVFITELSGDQKSVSWKCSDYTVSHFFTYKRNLSISMYFSLLNPNPEQKTVHLQKKSWNQKYILWIVFQSW